VCPVEVGWGWFRLVEVGWGWLSWGWTWVDIGLTNPQLPIYWSPELLTSLALRLPTAPPPPFRWKSSTSLGTQKKNWWQLRESWWFLTIHKCGSAIFNWQWMQWRLSDLVSLTHWHVVSLSISNNHRNIFPGLVRICHTTHKLIAKGWSRDGIKPARVPALMKGLLCTYTRWIGKGKTW
jgi:hypothetical protein